MLLFRNRHFVGLHSEGVARRACAALPAAYRAAVATQVAGARTGVLRAAYDVVQGSRNQIHFGLTVGGLGVAK